MLNEYITKKNHTFLFKCYYNYIITSIITHAIILLLITLKSEALKKTAHI